MNRREFLAGVASTGLASAGLGASTLLRAADPPDIALRISSVDVELAPGKIFKTTGYNGSAPGPVLRVSEGKPVTVEVHNDSPIAEVVHWHGLMIPPEVDGSIEEGTPAVPPHGSRRYTFTPRPSGTRWYHTHIPAGRDLKRGTYSGQFGFFYIEPTSEPAPFDGEVFVALHGWDPYFSTGGNEESGLEVAYKRFSINSRALGHAEPIRVKPGQRVMFRILNADATLKHSIGLAGHTFNVVALDGNPVPQPREVESIDLGSAERVDAIVTMNQPGVWILGETDDRIRNAGMGVVIEYANRSGEPQWKLPGPSRWDYTAFGDANPAPASPAERVPLVFQQKFAGSRWVDHWTINGKEFPKTDPIRVKTNQRYRLVFDNQSDEAHPVHLHRHSFELTRFAGQATRGVVKDVVMVPPRKQVEADFVADNPGPSLFHCHNQMHMDFGFMTMVRYD